SIIPCTGLLPSFVFSPFLSSFSTPLTVVPSFPTRRSSDLDYGPEGADLPGPEDRWGWYAEFPIPYNIDYQIEVHTRLQQQQVELAQLLAKEDRLPERGGYLEIPNVNVVASMDVIGGPVFTDGYDDDNKRYFEIRYIVRVFSEMTPWDIKRYNFPDQIVGRIYNRARTRQLGGFENQYTP